MGHRTITISDEAYNALKKKKKGKESFTDVILRLSDGGNVGKLLEFARSGELPDHELADNVEKVHKEFRRGLKIKAAEL